MSEQWKPCPGYEDTHEVSDQGRVRSVDTVLVNRNGVRRRWRGRELTPSPNALGYMMVTLSGNTTRKVAPLVLTAFVGPRPDGHVVLHLDSDPANNTLGNLRWGTQSENIRQSVRERTHRNSRKTECPRGHAYDANNGPYRRCRRCHADNERRRRARARQL